MDQEEQDLLTQRIIGCCFDVHTQLGPGFPERIYVNALKITLRKVGLQFEIEKEYIVKFDQTIVGKFRCDLVIENKVIVELKAVTGFQPKLFQNQLISYLTASKIKT